MRVRDGQRDFSGGMVDRVTPERLAENQYAYGKNVEIRHGGIRSRRGSWLLAGNAKNADTTEAEIVGSMVYRSPIVGFADTLILALYHSDTNTTTIHYSQMPAMDIRTELDLPATMVGRQDMRIVQAYDKVYFLRDGQQPMEWDGDFDAGLSFVADDVVLGSAPEARDGVYAFNRLWLIEDDDTVIPSDLLSAGWDRVSNEFRVEQGDGTRLVALKPFAGGSILALKERGIAIIIGASNFSDAGDLSVQFVSDRIGCVAADTAVQVGGDVFFLGGDGVWTVRQTTEQNAQLVEVALSEPIKGLINEINWLSVDKSSAVLFDNYYLLAIPVNGSPVPNRILVFDLLLKTWVGFWEYPETEEVDGDELFKHAKLAVARIVSGEILLTIGRYGAVGVLCKGDVKDWVGSIQVETYLYSAAGVGEFVCTAGYSINENYWWTSIGQVEATIRVDENDEIDIMVLKVFKDAGYAGEIVPYFRVYTSGGNVVMAARWQAAGPDDFTYSRPIDRNWHRYGIHCSGTASDGYTTGDYIHFTIDGRVVKSVIGGDWYGHMSPVDPFWEWIPSEDPLLSWCGITKGHLRGFDHRNGWYQVYKRTGIFSGASLRSVFDPGATFNATDIRTVTVNKFVIDTDIYGDFVNVVFHAENPDESEIIKCYVDDLVMPETDFDTDITSEIRTRGYAFGDMFSAKSALRGELRFAHGQPSVSMVMSSDIPFDTETLASLNAKTYSLTNYEVSGRAAWDATNVNNDFQTPFREDYAPIALGVQMGAAGLVLDKYREHTELFSSLAIFGWAQFTITNTQGFVRYNGLNLMAQDRNNEQDTGNNGN